jgi:predicted amidohydrolase YtcJ
VLIRNAEIGGRGSFDLRIERGRIVALGESLAAQPSEQPFDACGGALLPGLNDHHIHLLALAAAQSSVACGPVEVSSRTELAARLASAARPLEPGQWIRAVGYHEAVAGPLDRRDLDEFVPSRPLRMQHRSGALWMLNSRALRALGLDGDGGPAGLPGMGLPGMGLPGMGSPGRGQWGVADAGIERDESGAATGRLFRADALLRTRLEADPPDLAAIGRLLAARGVTGMTDATPTSGASELRIFEAASSSGALPQRLVLMGGATLPLPSAGTRIARGAHKLMLDERDLPCFDDVVETVRAAHANGRAIAIHCVTRSELVLATEAIRSAGALAGDRIEHASVAPPELVERVADLPLSVVTQPNFLLERGDAYAREVDSRDRRWLYRCRGFDDAGVPLGAGTDAPFGEPDPWAAMRAAVERRSLGGEAFSPGDEALEPERALALFTTPLEQPGGSPRTIRIGAAADLCLLDRPWREARSDLDSRHVRATWCGGQSVWQA